MKNTEHLQLWLAERAKRAGCAAEYARAVGLSGASVSELLRGVTKNIRPETVDAICSKEGITEEQLLAISKGQRETSVKKGDTFADIPARLAEFLRSLPKDRQDIIYATAGALGFSRNESSSSSANRSKAGAA